MGDDRALVQRRLAEIGLRAGGRYGFALAGGHAVAAHGILARQSEDVDLFADWQQRADFPAAVDQVIAAYQADGFTVDVEQRLDTFARLYLTEPERGDEPHRVELVANWRTQPPVQMDVGPVLHPDDVMAGKVDALCNRAAARDFLDIDAAISSGRYTIQHLCQIAREADPGFDQGMFANMLRYVERLDGDDFADYGLAVVDVADLKRRVAEWRQELAQ